MKNIVKLKLLLSFTFVCFCTIPTFTQNYFRYNTFELNKQVSFNDVAHFVKDVSRIITQASVYNTGEEILYYDDMDNIVRLSFVDDSQILKCITIKDISNSYYVESVKKSIFDQLGNPYWGYEKKRKVDVKKDYLMKDYETYDCLLDYIIGNYKINVWIYSSGQRLINTTSQEQLDLLSGDAHFLLEEYYKLYGKNVFNSSPLHTISVRINQVEENDYRKSQYPPSIQSQDYGWMKVNTSVIKKW